MPQIFLMAPPKSEIIIVSPWVAELTLYPPRIISPSLEYKDNQMLLSEFLCLLAVKFDYHLLMVVRPPENGDQRLQRVVKPLKNAMPKNLKIIKDDTVHAKAFVTEKFVITGSSNALPRSLHYNKEYTNLSVNTSGSSRRWVRDELNIYV
jgi:phosphatidylserine/phosphatidylglycerophosphate/cardiolipin synthase-like enzyme